MTEEKKAPAKKAAAPKKEAAPKKVAAKKDPATAPRAAQDKGTLTVVQTGSPIGRQAVQQQTLVGLGLNKIGRSRTLKDTPEVRGMIARVKHLVKVN